MVAKKTAGRPPYAPSDKDRKMVEALCGFGIPAEKIAHVLGVSLPTVHKYFAAELERGAATVEAKLVGNLLRLSNGNDGTALKATIFALTTRFGYSQYAPLPVAKEPPLGKKAALEIEAETGHKDTSWGALLN